MKGHGEKLSRKQEQAVAALIAQPTMAAAATATGVSEATLWRWLRIPEFADLYRRTRWQTVCQALGTVQSASSEAVETLRAIMADASAPVPSRVSAARAVLETAFRAVELEDLAERLARLEAMAEAAPDRGATGSSA